ncbi:helix-turn-helix transcriptional regulator [Haloechinothrix sp. YIM 98757]|uniref:Helix-turn-helix transcriptional regulator n=1 Tax=Haloechinothrix aidingensis TaxID=2752311 RepID=A0A838AA19_9PSEU|nr:helix-turn-helix domain-containing protein [Haloechinothrix aidingensis]MBA0125801.1 helix-turn-helix transcriptional regulator [Haloechinothrix aidingensis]
MIRAGERLFASRGVDGALTRDIVAEAGQSNGSAVHYHFGSRRGLLEAILVKHVRRMEPARAEHQRLLERDGLHGELTAVVRGILDPTADALHSGDGRDFLRITAQLAGYAGIRAITPPQPLTGTVLQHQLELAVRCCAERLSERLARERVATIAGMLASTLADRARQLDEGGTLLLAHEAFVDNLTRMVVGALSAPAPQGGA